MLITGGFPAVVYMSTEGLMIAAAMDVDGATWNSPVTAASPNQMTSTYGAAVIDGYPAVTYGAFGGDPDGYQYRRASNAYGSSWTAARLIDVSTLNLIDMMDLNYMAAICYDDPHHSYSLAFRRAETVGGSAWAAPVAVDLAVLVGNSPKITIANGNPAIQYWDLAPESITPIYFIRANDATGDTWGERVLIDSLQFGLFSNDLAIVDGKPASVYVGGPEKHVYFKHALDADGASWPETADAVIPIATYAETSLADIGGFPAIAISKESTTEQDILFAIFY
jgi:hypothetical protein